MANPLPKIECPNLVFGFVCAVGADISETLNQFENKFRALGYQVINITISKHFDKIARKITPETPLNASTEYDRIRTYIKYGNQLRKNYADPAVLTSIAVYDIVKQRADASGATREPERTVYLIRQFKRKEEVDLLRSIYGRLFFQISVFSRRAARIEYLARKFADDAGSADVKAYRAQAEDLVQTDENEITDEFGQRVGQIFHDADFIVSADSLSPSVKVQIDRFCELLFGSNSISPTKHEYGMFLARAAALRTLDLSRQVGAAVFSDQGEVICLGSNEVPKANGGTYWSDDKFDDREYKRGLDSNDKRKKELLTEVLKAYDSNFEMATMFDNKEIRDSQFMDALEYGRIVHAEMSAISDAARNGRPIRNSIMYATTFPCHMCAKHIIASGISKVVFLEPYPKSLAEGLHADSIEFESSERGKYTKFPAVKFEHFFGITPRRYRELFERGIRKDAEGKFRPYVTGQNPIPTINIIYPFYQSFEDVVIAEYKELLSAAD